MSRAHCPSTPSQLILQPFFRFSYVTGSSHTSPGEPPMKYGNIYYNTDRDCKLRKVGLSESRFLDLTLLRTMDNTFFLKKSPSLVRKGRGMSNITFPDTKMSTLTVNFISIKVWWKEDRYQFTGNRVKILFWWTYVKPCIIMSEDWTKTNEANIQNYGDLFSIKSNIWIFAYFVKVITF